MARPTFQLSWCSRRRSGTYELPGLSIRRFPRLRLLREAWAHSSVVECLLCKEDALGSNPSGSTRTDRRAGTAYLMWLSALRSGPTDAPPRASAGGKGRDTHRVAPGVCMRPCVRAIQASTGPIQWDPTDVATVPPGEWLGSSADEGRAKLR